MRTINRQRPPDSGAIEVLPDAPPVLTPGDGMASTPRRRSRISPQSARSLLLAAAAGAAASLLLRLVSDWHGIMGTLVWAYGWFLVTFYTLESDQSTPEMAVDRIVTTLMWSAAAVVVGVLGWMLAFLAVKGFQALRPGFFTQDLSQVGPLSPGGGAYHAVVGTFLQVGLATLAVVPISILTAIYLHEIKGRLAGLIRFVVDAMAGLPSIVAGLLVFTIWNTAHGFSGASGSAALVVLMLPTVTRASEEILRTIPDALREASLALGAPEWRTVGSVVLPAALAGLTTAAILGVARAVGETAPMLLTALGSDHTNYNVTNGPQSDLPLFVWKLIRLPNATSVARAWTGALVLVGLVLTLFVLARLIAGRSHRRLGGGR